MPLNSIKHFKQWTNFRGTISWEGNAANLTDDYTIHGCDFQSRISVIKNGVPAKGMTPFKDQLSQKEMEQLSSFIGSLKGSNSENAKVPEGGKCK